MLTLLIKGTVVCPLLLPTMRVALPLRESWIEPYVEMERLSEKMEQFGETG